MLGIGNNNDDSKSFLMLGLGWMAKLLVGGTIDTAREEKCFSTGFIGRDFPPVFAGWQGSFCRFMERF